MAHLILTGNFTTPWSAASSPSAPLSTEKMSTSSAPSESFEDSPSSLVSWIDIIDLNVRMRSRASVTDLPFTAADMSDAEDWLIEHPCPVIRMSPTTPSSTCKKTMTSSPHRGLNPSIL